MGTASPVVENQQGTVDLPEGKLLVLFDGVCNLCNGRVDFLIRRDDRMRFLFAPLQSEVGKDLLEARGLPTDQMDTFVALTKKGTYTKSRAVLEVLLRMRRLWPVLGVLGFLFPWFLRDAIYDYVARKRYRWYGKQETCRLPTPSERARFLA